MNIVLCGLPGTGKSVIGRLLAEKMHRQFVDTDDLLEKRHRQPCRALYKKLGKERFRELEEKEIEMLQNYTDHVIATGGGFVENPQSLAMVEKLGCVVHLRTDFIQLYYRKVELDSPAYLDQSDYRTICDRRLPLFEKISNIEVDIANCDPQSAALLIKKAVLGYIDAYDFN